MASAIGSEMTSHPLGIPLEDLIFTGLLKEGYFSCIHLARSTSEELRNKFFIVKIFKADVSEGDNPFATARMYKEIKARHNNIVQMIGFCVHPNIHAYVMKFEGLETDIPGRNIYDLHSYLVYLREIFQDRGDTIKNDQICTDHKLHSYAVDIALACQFLHENNIIHGDLATRNILLTPNHTIKLADFGLHRTKANIIAKNHSKVTFRWRSPEHMLHGRNMKEEDIWSFGIVLWEIATLGGLPYSNYPNNIVDEKIRNGEKLKLAPIVLLCGVKTTINRCLKNDRNVPSTFEEIIKEMRHPKCTNKICKFYNTIRFLEKYQPLPNLPTPDDLYYFQQELPEITSITFTKCATHLGSGAFAKTYLHHLQFPVPGYVSLVEKNFYDVFKGDLLLNHKIREISRKVGYHPNVVKIIALYTQFTPSLLLEYQAITIHGQVDITSFQNYLTHLRKDTPVYGKEFGWFSLQIARGMGFLRRKEITHGNLKTRNILINNINVLKITDYFNDVIELKRSYTEISERKYLPSCRWASPELIKTAKSTFESDVWAFGITLWEIATLAELPFSDLKDRDIIMCRLDSRTLLPPKPDSVTDEVWQIMISCWNDIPHERPEMETIESHILSLTSEKEIFKHIRDQQQLKKLNLPTSFEPPQHDNQSGELNYWLPSPQPPRYQSQLSSAMNQSPSFQHQPNCYQKPFPSSQNPSKPHQKALRTHQPLLPLSQGQSSPSYPSQVPSRFPPHIDKLNYRLPMPRPPLNQSQLSFPRFPFAPKERLFQRSSGSSNRPIYPPLIQHTKAFQTERQREEYVASLMANISLQEPQTNFRSRNTPLVPLATPTPVPPNIPLSITIPPEKYSCSTCRLCKFPKFFCRCSSANK